MQITAAVNSTTIDDWPNIIATSIAHARLVVPFIGIHPWLVAQLSQSARDEAFRSLEEMTLSQVGSTRAVGIGEIGLDKSATHKGSLPEQIDLFRRQLRLAGFHRLPVTIHCVKAWEELLLALKTEEPGDTPLIFHSFIGDEQRIRLLSRWNSFFSIRTAGPSSIAKKGREMLVHWGSQPTFHTSSKGNLRDRLLIETDLPADEVITPQEYGTLLQESYQTASTALGIPLSLLAKLTLENFTRATQRTKHQLSVKG